MGIFFDKYLSTLRIIGSQYGVEKLKNKMLINTVLKDVQKSDIDFFSLNLINIDGDIISCCNNDKYFTRHEIFNIPGIKAGQDCFIDHIITISGQPYIIVGIKLIKNSTEPYFLAGIIDNLTINSFLEENRIEDIVDVYLMDNNGVLLTPSVYFGKPGLKAPLPEKEKFPSSMMVSNPDKKKKGGKFLFLGVNKIDNTDMKLGILLSSTDFEAFMSRVKYHIFTMAFLSILFIIVTLAVLVTHVVRIYYRADKVRQVYLAKAAHNSKMASIGQLAAGVAHEINNPLAIINEKAGLLQDLFTFVDEYKSDKRVLSAIDAIIAAVERAGTITHRLLGFARKTDSSIQAVSIEDTVSEVIEFVKKEMENKSIRVNLHIPAYFPKIITDQGKLQQILINLVNNALAAMDEKGILTIEAKKNPHDKSIKIYVKDNGCGISSEDQKKIFEPFFTTKAEIGGTGLGLALTYGLVRDLHGSLEFESSKGVGTTFIITLPYKIEETE